MQLVYLFIAAAIAVVEAYSSFTTGEADQAAFNGALLFLILAKLETLE